MSANEGTGSPSPEPFRMLVERSADGLVVVDPAGAVRFANPATRSILGTGFDSLAVQGIGPSGAQEPALLTVRDGEALRQVELIPRAIAWEGQPATLLSLRDVTARELARSRLVEEHEQFRTVIDQKVAGLYVIQDGRLAFTNKRFAELLGIDDPRDMVGLRLEEFIAPEDVAGVRENIRQGMAGEIRSKQNEVRLLRRDGTRVEVSAHGSMSTFQGRPAVIGVLQDISDRKRAELAVQRYIKQLEEAFLLTVEVATALSEMRDPYTAGHERRVAALAVAIGRELGHEGDVLEGLRVAGMLHDIGKIHVPSEILAKPGNLSAVEYEMVKGHVDAGYEVLKNIDFPWPVADMVRQHHERMDGTGYPLGLKGEAILPQSRILAVADTVEAMSSHRPYRPAAGIAAALAEIERGRGTIYDPAVADACLRLFRDKGYVIPE